MIKQTIRNKNGYTMIELLATIVIIAIISTLTITALLSNINKSQAIKQEQNIKSIEEASLIYIKEYGSILENWQYKYTDESNTQIEEKYYCVTVEELINKGYLNKNIIDGDIKNNSLIKITQNIENKTYTTSELINNGVCN
jgi:prepilin-type N-terminal cleavage/methylation domain-containing protein